VPMSVEPADVRRARRKSGESAACCRPVAAPLPLRYRSVAAVVLREARGGGGGGRTFLLRRNALCSIHILENSFIFFLFFLRM